MGAILRRWQSIDRKLPLLASGLVVLTATLLAWTAYARLEAALLESAGERLLGTAQTLSQLVMRPGSRLDSLARRTDEALRQIAAGHGSRDRVMRLLALSPYPMDTTK